MQHPCRGSGRNNGSMTESANDTLQPRQYQALLDVSESITRHGDLAELFHENTTPRHGTVERLA